jgi:putative transposase
MDSQLLERFL